MLLAFLIGPEDMVGVYGKVVDQDSCESGERASQGRCENRWAQKSLACDVLSRANTVTDRKRWESAGNSRELVVMAVAMLVKALKARR